MNRNCSSPPPVIDALRRELLIAQRRNRLLERQVARLVDHCGTLGDHVTRLMDEKQFVVEQHAPRLAEQIYPGCRFVSSWEHG